MTAELVSICIPAYNGAEYLEPCIRSAQQQTYEPIEILIVDDGSNDATLSIARSLSAGDARIRLIANEKNLGLVGNWNRCVALARGSWIKFLFQDDLITPDCVDRLLSEGRTQRKRLIGCDRNFIFDDSIEADMRAAYVRNRGVINGCLASHRGASAEAYAELIAHRLAYNHFGEPTTSLIHRSVFDQYGGFCEDLIHLCDLEYWARVGGQEGLAYVPERLASFRAHQGGTSASNRSQRGFRASGLDPLILVSKMLVEPVYEGLRANWINAHLLELVRKQAEDRANYVREFVGKNASLPFGAHTYGQEYAAFLKRYPQCEVTNWQHRRWRARQLPGRVRQRVWERLKFMLPPSWSGRDPLPF